MSEEEVAHMFEELIEFLYEDLELSINTYDFYRLEHKFFSLCGYPGEDE